MRIFKVFVLILMITVVTLGATAAYITQVLDPNDLKPTLVDAAKKEQITLQLNGNISWAFWPWFGISVKNVEASAQNWTFKADEVEGSLSILSLFSDTVVIDSLTAIAPQVRVNEATTKNDSSNSITETQAPKKSILVRQLAIQDGVINGIYPGLALDRVQFSVDSLSPATASPLKLSTYATFGTFQVPVELEAQIIPTATFDGLTIRDFRFKSRQLNLEYTGYLSASQSGQFSGEGQIAISPFQLRQWLRAGNFPVPDTRDLDRLGEVFFESGIKLSNDLLSLRPFSLQVDETSIDGRIDLNLDPLNVDLELLADQLNLDGYLTGDGTNDEAKSKNVGVLPGTYKLDLGALTINSHRMTDVGIDLGIGADEITLGRLDAKLFGGEVRAAGTHLIAPQISNITGTINGIQLAQFQLSEPLDTLSGALQSSFDLRAAGRTPDEVLASVSGPLRLKVQDAFLGPLNVSDAVCQSLQAQSEPATEAADTLTLSGEFQEGIAVIEALDATVANLSIQGKGRVSLISTASNIQGSIKIPDSGSLGTCRAPEIVRGATLPLSCRGQLRNGSLKCGIDEGALRQLIAKAAEKELRKRAEQKLEEAEAKLKSSVEETLKKKLNNQGAELLKNLLSR